MPVLSDDAVVLKAGGPIDETRVTIAIYGDALDPDKISTLVGVAPTRSFTKGYRKTERSKPMPHGAWLLTIAGSAPMGPEELISAVLSRVPTSPGTWSTIRAQFDLQIRVGLHLDAWNRGFQLSPKILAAIAVTGASLGFDIYAYGEEHDV